ncbi:hypothetical protein DCAR_0417994 [Daucus carota subsp. sativus]|uniref:Uncharacterized protein n=1 Tax=Daucus carota subsp. sativus TaxID=79200 RepID=A0A162AE72_DAUCS|nr:hypothetical protein DCAR_0417994 [Daucus carota subsp. sativus]
MMLLSMYKGMNHSLNLKFLMGLLKHCRSGKDTPKFPYMLHHGIQNLMAVAAGAHLQ